MLPPDKSVPTLATLLNNLPGMAYRCRFNRRRSMTFVSAGCQDLTGYRPGDLVNDNLVAFDDLIHPEDKASVFAEIETSIREKRPFKCSYRLTTKAGDEGWVLDWGEAVIDARDTVVALEGFVSDYTERMTAFELLEQRVDDRTRKLTALYDILEVASDPSDLNTTISRSLRRVLKAIKGNVGAIHLLDKNGAILKMVAQQDLPAEIARNFGEITVRGNDLAGWVVQQNKPLLIAQMSTDPRTKELAFNSDLDVLIAVPIVANDQVRGVFTVLSDDLSRYTAKEEMELLTSVGEQLGVVVENARLRQQAEQLVVLEERNRLARELHDSVTQSLYSVTLFAEAGLNVTESGDFEQVGQLFHDVLETGQQALKEMRLLVHKLRPSVLEKEGLVRALQHRLNAVEGRAGVKNQLVVEGSLDMSLEVEEALYHVIQEALNNALKHANASEVRIYIQQDQTGMVNLVVSDNGRGFDLNTAEAGSGLGLISMRERLENLEGTIHYQSTAGQGTEVKIQLPAKRNRRE